MKKADEEFKQKQNETQAANNDNNQQWNEMREQIMDGPAQQWAHFCWNRIIHII